VGGVIGLEAMFAGPICGASMNPARSLAPALVSGTLRSLWLYLVAPVVGAAIAVPCWRLTRSTASVGAPAPAEKLPLEA
jgi:aquaporin NIP